MRLLGEGIAPLSIPEIEKAERAHAYTSRIGAELKEQVSAKRHSEISQAVRPAAALVDSLGVYPEYLDPTKPLNWERGALHLGVAAADIASSRPRLFSNQKARMRAQLLFPPEMRPKKDKEPFSEAGLRQWEVLRELLKRSWPELGGDVRKIKQFHARGNLVELPYRYGWNQPDTVPSLQREIRDISAQLGIPAMAYPGFAIPEERVGFVVTNATELERAHEDTHASYPNLRVGYYGISLNEGMTQILAGRKIEREERYNDEYGAERALVYRVGRLAQADTELEKRYKQASHTTVKSLAGKLVDRFGLANYAVAYLSHPNAHVEHELTTSYASSGENYFRIKAGIAFHHATSYLPTYPVRTELEYAA